MRKATPKKPAAAVVQKKPKKVIRKLHRHVILSTATIVPPSRAKSAPWGCCMNQTAKMLDIPTSEYLPKSFDAHKLEQLKKQLNYTGSACPATEIAGPHAGTHCGMRLYMHLQHELKRVQSELQLTLPVRPQHV